jgi:molybdopterin converting factor small subunit
MEITVKLFPTLYAQAAGELPTGKKLTISLSAALKSQPTIRDLIGHLGLDEKKVHQAILNGQIVRNFNHMLKAGDYIYLSPPIGGG